MAGSYDCLSTFTYGQLEAFTYAQLEILACASVAPAAIPTAEVVYPLTVTEQVQPNLVGTAEAVYQPTVTERVLPSTISAAVGNLVANPSFETDTAGWSVSGTTLTRTAGGAAFGGF